jgi:hypothetical protein
MMFRDLALFLARAVLRSEGSEKGIVQRLREIGFAASEPMNVARFPIDSLTVLALAMFAYLVTMSAFEEDCRRAVLVVSAGEAPPGCAAALRAGTQAARAASTLPAISSILNDQTEAVVEIVELLFGVS